MANCFGIKGELLGKKISKVFENTILTGPLPYHHRVTHRSDLKFFTFEGYRIPIKFLKT